MLKDLHNLLYFCGGGNVDQSGNNDFGRVDNEDDNNIDDKEIPKVVKGDYDNLEQDNLEDSLPYDPEEENLEDSQNATLFKPKRGNNTKDMESINIFTMLYHASIIHFLYCSENNSY